jgi:hypothetical protein
MRYIIIKHIPISSEQTLPVIMLDTHSEVWEFDHETDAKDMAAILEANSYSGSKYEVKTV